MRYERIILSIIDLVCLTVTFSVSLLIRQSLWIASRFGPISYEPKIYLISYAIGAILIIFVFSSFRLYTVRTIEISARIFTVLKALVLWTLTITLLVYILKFDFSRSVLFMTVTGASVLICLGRYAYFRYRLNRKKDADMDLHMIGTGGRADEIEKQLKDSLPKLSITRHDFNTSQSRQELARIKSSDIFIADEYLSREAVMKILADTDLKHHTWRVIMDTFRLTTGDVRPNDLDEIPSISTNHSPHLFYMMTKRIIDIVVATVGIILVSPLWLFIAILIKLDSKGPILIKQSRIGTRSHPFTMLKFRTMRYSSVQYEFAPQDSNDTRITKTGRLLRRFSLDELPQLWNIVKGDMSLVGPRPEMEFIVRTYEPWQELRLKVKPGLTGLWQILGRKDIPLHENLEYDFYYVCNQSIFLDATILMKTIPAVLFGRGAY